MATLREHLAKMFPGVHEERIAERTQGCWNCTHFNREKAKQLWWDKARGDMLNRAIVLATTSPKGENDPRVYNLRKQIPMIDAKIEIGELGCCRVGKKPDGSQIDDFVFSTYLCGIWTGAQGASVARAGQGPDKQPEELMERLHEKKVE